MKTGLFPSVPKDLAKLSDKELSDLLAEFEHNAGLIDAEDEEFLAGLAADDIIEQYEQGRDAILLLRTEVTARDEAAEAYEERKAALRDSLKVEVKAESTEGDDAGDGDGDESGDESGDGEGDGEDEGTQSAEADADEVQDPVREKVLVAASETSGDGGGDGDGDGDEGGDSSAHTRMLRRTGVPAPAAERIVVKEKERLAFVASGLVPSTPPGTAFESTVELAEGCRSMMRGLGKPSKSREGREDRFKVATLDFRANYPEDRVLVASDLQGNARKIAAVGNPFLTGGMEALIASGGLCAPLEPIYTMPQYATRDRPVRDALPSFRAERGGVNVPVPTIMGDAAGAITVITAEEDGLGGTFATKACLDLDCPDYNETAVTIISHCREYGNLGSMAWPEKIAHENELTMAEHARIAESYLLGRLKTLSLNVTTGADTLGALIYLVDGIAKAAFGQRSRLRLPAEARFQLLAPRVLLDLLLVDTVSTQLDRYRSKAAIEDYLASIGVDVTWYLDSPLQVGDATAAPGTSQIADAAQTAAAIDGFPANIQMAFFPAGTFLHLDMAELNLGIVRDSTLNSTNDYQVFGETFENVALIGSEQAAYWITANICPTGAFPAAGTTRTCE
jgi:hypothetical protein